VTPADSVPDFRLPEDRTLSLEAAIQLALQRNQDLSVRRVEPELRALDVLREESDFRPELFGLAQFGEERASEISRGTGERFNVDAEERRTELGIQQNFSTGTDVRFALSERKDASNRAPTQEEVRADLELTQALLRGRGENVNRISVQQTELGVEISIAELRGYLLALIAETEIAYWRLQLTLEAVEITRQSLEVAEQQLSEVKQRIELGQLAQNQQAASEAEVAGRKQNMIDAQATFEQQQLRMNRLLDVETSSDTPLRPVTLLEIEDEPVDDPSPWLDRVFRLNPSLQEARIRLQQDELEVIRTQNGLLPRLDFFSTLAKIGFGQDVSGARTAFSEDTYEWMFGLRFSKELGTSLNKVDDQTANLLRGQSELAVENLEDQLQTDVRLAIVEHNRALAQIRAGAETRRLREQTAQAERDRFDVGASTSLLVAQAQREVLESRINELENRIDFRIALVRLQELTGTLLDRYGVEVNRE
jgi:outer membrane protein TolC